MTSRLPAVLSRDDLPEAELHAARLDGEVFGVDECFSPIDEIERSALRAMALAVTLPPRLIAEQRTAAWILGALDAAPATHQLCADIHARVRPGPAARAIVREVVIDDEELFDCAGMRVTTPLRTVIDLARFSASFDLAERTIAIALMALGSFDFEACAAAIDARRNLPGKNRALRRLGTLAAGAQPALTRYTS